MPTLISDDLLEQLACMIDDACKRGDTVSAIAERAGLQREFVSGLRNHTYRSSPTIDRFKAVCDAIGVKISLEK